MPTFPIFEAKTRLSELLVRAQQGEVITITRHGTPAGRLVAADSAPGQHAAGDQAARVEQAFDALDQLRQGVTLDLPLRDVLALGRD